MVGSFFQVYRTVILDNLAKKFVDENSAIKNGRFGEQWEGLEWLLCHTPAIGVQGKPPYMFYVAAKDEIADTKEVWVLYSYGDDCVTIHAIQFGDD